MHKVVRKSFLGIAMVLVVLLPGQVVLGQEEAATAAPDATAGLSNETDEALPSAVNELVSAATEVEFAPHPGIALTGEHNVIWAATFQQAWQQAGSDLGAPLKLQSGPSWAADLATPGAANLLPADGVLAFGGLATQQNVLQLTQQIYETFPVADLPFESPALVDDNGLLLAGFTRKIVLWEESFQSGPQLPLTFPSASGDAPQPVRAFGFPAGAGQNFTRMVSVLGYRSPEFFAIKVQPHNSYEYVVFARGKFGPTITDTVNHLRLLMQYRKGIEEGTVTKSLKMWGPPQLLLTPADRLVLPEIQVSANFRLDTLSGEAVVTSDGAQNPLLIQEAVQGVYLEVGSQGQYPATDSFVQNARPSEGSASLNMEFSGPFSISLWQQGATFPYLFLQINNADLLVPAE